MRKIDQKIFVGERSLFQERDLEINDTVFGEGESPLKGSENISLNNCVFEWKYPLWYSKNITMRDCHFLEMGRAGVWYTNNISIENSVIEAPKNFRRCKGVTLKDVYLPNASETLWNCSEVVLEKVNAKGDYFAMNCSDMKINGFNLSGNYSFDGARNVELTGGRLLSKDAFWNAENIVVRDSFISGEYIGWNSKNITFINCTIESLQGLCYIENLIMKNCKLINTTLAFEYSSADAEIVSSIDSVFNPREGIIKAKSIGELTLDPERINPENTKIVTEE